MDSTASVFGNKLRIRLCGLLVQQESILLVKIHSPVTDDLIWTPPGGGLQFGESMRECLKREFKEETNLQVEVDRLIHINELIDPPFHAVECYFELQRKQGKIKLGTDPEVDEGRPLLKDLAWVPIEQLSTIAFSPESLIDKLQHWNQRTSFRPFSGNNIER